MKGRISRLIRNPYFLIAITYLSAHFFMLLLSGCWWDDWTFSTHDLEYVATVASESGRPEWNLLVPFCWSLPKNGRILIFFLYLFISFFIYVICANCGLFNNEESFFVALIFSVIPVNDARILISNFAYTIGYFFFYLSFMLFVFWNRMKNRKRTVFRIIILISFYISFILNSVLAYYYILFAYLFVMAIKANKESSNVKRVLNSIKDILLKYPDFFVLPFLYYGVNKTFFPTYGSTFGNYNSVSISGLLKSFLYVPVSVMNVFPEIVKRNIQCLNIYTIIYLLTVVLFSILLFGRCKTEEKHETSDIILKSIIGLFVMAMAVFPYVMVRGKAIYLTGVKGRDAVLLPLGLAVLCNSVLEAFKENVRKVLLPLLLALGIISFNSLYIEWQKDYYYQLSMERLFDNTFIRENDTFFLVDLNETDIEAQRYYSLNVNSYNVFKDETRFFVPKVSNLYILENEKYMKDAIEALHYSHKMKDYQPEDYCFDAVLNYRNDLSWKEVIGLKIYELANQKKFNEIIDSRGEMDVYIVDNDFTVRLLKEYDGNQLDGDEDVLKLAIEYSTQ